MIAASGLRPGMAIRFEDRLVRVMGATYHGGQGKMGGVMHARLKDLSTGKLWDHSFRAEMPLEEIPIQKRSLEYLYTDGEHLCFMDTETFEQIEILATDAGHAAPFLRPEMILTADTAEGTVIGLNLPEYVQAVVADTAPPVRQTEATWKVARLDNEVEIMVPPFIRTGDAVRVDILNLKYVERAKSAGKP